LDIYRELSQTELRKMNYLIQKLVLNRDKVKLVITADESMLKIEK